jgi:hypothetical protein
MANLNMNGPFKLDNETIDTAITNKTAGNYALGNINGVIFYIEYIGRSDDDLNARLKSHIGENDFFKYSVASSVKEAFEKECKNYHDFGENTILKNDKHPDRPDGKNWKCSYCKNFE